MYLSGMDIYDIMKITGHTSPAMLRKYIKAENLTVVEKSQTNITTSTDGRKRKKM